MSRYVEDGVNIHSEAFNQDFDDIGYDPITDTGDNDEEAAEIFGY